MKIPLVMCAFALLGVLAGCSSQAPLATPSTSLSSASVAPSAPLQEPFQSTLVRWNYYRASAGVPPIVADQMLNEAALHHAKYLVNNHIDAGDAVIKNGRMIESGWNASAHAESVGNPWYTEDGEKWAEYASVIRGTGPVTDGTSLVDEQAARTDSLAVLDPQLASVGFGIFCAKDDCVGVIIYRRGLTKSQFLSLYEGNSMEWNPMLGTMPFTSARLRKPIEFPSGGMQFPSRAFRGGDYPDPLAACHGYSAPTGVPIVLQLGAPMEGEDVKMSSNSLSEDGSQIETCSFDSTSYANPDGYQQSRFRDGLRAYGAVVVIPKNPLQPGHQYTVSIVADSQPYSWSFSVAPDAK
jgi:hypothetical protein